MNTIRFLSLIVIQIILVSCTSDTENEIIPPSKSRNFIVYGDTRTQHDIHQQIVDRILETSPDIIFHTGDLVENGLDAGEWEMFNGITSVLRSSAEMFPVAGNHEQESSYYYDNFNLPNNEKWYDVEYDNIHFIVLNSNLSLYTDSEQYMWLEDNLQNIKKNIKFTVVFFHHPLFSTGPHSADEMGVGDILIPLFERSGVDLVFSGHDHDYERSMFNDIYYIVSGGGGAPLYDQVSTSKYSQVFESKHHFCTLYLTNETLQMKVFDLDSILIDEIAIH
jgi:acid phosphatase type 7